MNATALSAFAAVGPLKAVGAAEQNPVLNISIFLLFVAVTMVIVIRASRNNRTAADFYAAAGRSPVAKTDSRSRGITSPRRRSWGSVARSR